MQETAERQARGEIERVYHEIRQSMLVTGVNLNFRTWARYSKFFPAMWDAMAENVRTRFFETGADDIRREAAALAEKLGQVTTPSVQIGESQRYQIQSALWLYHYINPKLLLFTAAVARALEHSHEPAVHDRVVDHIERIQQGSPARMYPMEMVEIPPTDRKVSRIFDDIKRTLSTDSVNSDYRTLALWPDYLEGAWTQLKPIVQRAEFKQSAETLRQHARALASSLPFPVRLSRDTVRRLERGREREILATTQRFEKVLPGLILNVTLLALEWSEAEVVMRSPFPV